MKSLTVFCGSNTGNHSSYLQACDQLAELLVTRNMELVYGGSHLGLMGRLADAVLSRGGKVTGVIPERLVEKEIAHTGLTMLVVVKTMHERKARMAELCDGFLALPGGIGTIEEIMEVYTWNQLGYHAKPCALLNINGYYDHLNSFLDHMVNARFLREEQRSLLLSGDNIETLIDQMASTKIEFQDKWINGK
ncbi:TIGR00730 family Rossman fold protein [Chitinophaga agrisoli]|uniref:Cytokinin riboside 5'-monophosphate phosphoribohydrolase n=1 Tax=Chitinophaga agrisoli TaxID=2607653 RepID=A0A5B2VKC1_9BACT|nr:TIGR00730 family Rossman fold protein [Chitinophaga agrisoli]KAA2239521.1 TIGR00730 family Rossman fold protein [Chitinophaga agrisoli]